MLLQRVEIKPSPTLATVLCAVHLAAGAAVWFDRSPPWLNCMLIATITAGLAWAVYSRALLRPAWAIVALEITAAGRMSFLRRCGTWHACELLGTTYVSPHLTILNLRLEGRRFARHVVLVPDNVDAQDFRRLRTWLRWSPKPDRLDSTGVPADSG